MGRVARKKSERSSSSKGIAKSTTGQAKKAKQQVSKRPSQKEKTLSGEEYEYTIGGSVVNKWKPLGRTTLQFTQQLINSSSSQALSRVHPEDYEDAQAVLEELKTRVTESLVGLKAPAPVCMDYANLRRQTDSLQNELDANLAQAERIEEEIQLLEKKSEEFEWELAKRKKPT